MVNLDILTKIPTSKYIEKAIETDFGEFKKVVESRRSVRIFTEEKIPDKIVEECIDLGLLAANSSNLQPWEFYRVKDLAKKKELAKICMSQIAARSAAELIVCVARTDKWRDRQQDMLRLFDENTEIEVPKSAEYYYKTIVPLAYNQGPLGIIGLFKKCLFFIQGLTKVTPREPTDKSDMRVWAHKSTALACENIMLAFRAAGFDSCPMEGFDSKRAKKLLNLDSKAEICMIIAAGRRAENGVFGPRVRMEKSKFYLEV